MLSPSSVRRNAIFANMPFQILASILMIITLYIYHGYDKDEPSQQEVVDEALKHKNAAIALLFISRFLSGFAAGMSLAAIGRAGSDTLFSILGMCCVVSTSYLNEISPRALRGTVGACHQLAVVIGILLAQILGLPWILGRHK